jgi:hypothetical protein
MRSPDAGASPKDKTGGSSGDDPPAQSPQRDSNPRPLAPEANALSSLSYGGLSLKNLPQSAGSVNAGRPRVCPNIVGQLRAVVLQGGQARQNRDIPRPRRMTGIIPEWAGLGHDIPEHTRADPGDPPMPLQQEPSARPLPDPFPDYVTCPVCGEPDIEIWCYEETVRCPTCGAEISHGPFPLLDHLPPTPPLPSDPMTNIIGWARRLSRHMTNHTPIL